MSYTIRKILVSDIDEFYRLRLEGLEQFSPAFWETPDELTSKGVKSQLERLRAIEDSKDAFIIGAFEEEKLVGICGCRREDGAKGYHRATIWGMYVDSSKQGSGIGGATLDMAIEEAQKLGGLESLFLMVAANNLPALGLYHSRGFRAYGIEPMSLKDKGAFVAEFMMIKKL
ncbi:MAG TPA: N-acetyltransferase [Candidatus Kapabacteria bacterium]